MEVDVALTDCQVCGSGGATNGMCGLCRAELGGAEIRYNANEDGAPWAWDEGPTEDRWIAEPLDLKGPMPEVLGMFRVRGEGKLYSPDRTFMVAGTGAAKRLANLLNDEAGSYPSARIEELEQQLADAYDDIDDMAREAVGARWSPWLCRAEGVLVGLIIAVVLTPL